MDFSGQAYELAYWFLDYTARPNAYIESFAVDDFVRIICNFPVYFGNRLSEFPFSTFGSIRFFAILEYV